MSEQFDYIRSRIEEAREGKLSRMLHGHHKTLEDLRYDVGYLKALQDIDQFGIDYVSSKNPPKQEEDDE